METRTDTHTPPAGAGGGARPHAGAAPHNDPDRARQEIKQQGQAAWDETRSAARDATREVKGQAAELAQQAKQSVSAATDQAKRTAADYARQAKDRGQDLLAQQKETAAAQLHTVGEAVHRAADKFREDKDDNIAGYVDAFADEVDRLSGYLKGRDLPAVWHDAQDFARRRPEWFLGGMFVAGLALTRFLKASARRHDQPGDYGYGGSRDFDAGHLADHRPTPATGTAGSAASFETAPKLPDPAQATHAFTNAAGTWPTTAPAGGSVTSVRTTDAPVTTVAPTTQGAVLPPALPPTLPGVQRPDQREVH